MSENEEIEKRYFPIPKPLAEMTVEERRQYATELADFIFQNENLTPPGLSQLARNDPPGRRNSGARLAVQHSGFFIS